MPPPIFRAIPIAILSLSLASCSTTSNSGSGPSKPHPSGQSNAGPADAPQGTTLPTGEQMCGGIARLPCPQGKACEDIPEDDCDPARGGRDCGGVCVDTTDTPQAPKGCVSPDPQKKKYFGQSPDECARIRFVCAPGMRYFSDDCGCGCQKTEG